MYDIKVNGVFCNCYPYDMHVYVHTHARAYLYEETKNVNLYTRVCLCTYCVYIYLNSIYNPITVAVYIYWYILLFINMKNELLSCA